MASGEAPRPREWEPARPTLSTDRRPRGNAFEECRASTAGRDSSSSFGHTEVIDSSPGCEETSRPGSAAVIVGGVPRTTALHTLAGQPRLAHGFSTVAMGSMGLGPALDPLPVLESRRRFAAELGLDPASITPVGAVHGADLARVDVARQLVAEVDGLVTDTPGIALFATFADCYPLLAYDPVNQAVGLAHAGWRGTASGIAEKLVATMEANFDSDPGALLIGIGPGICGSCYEVGSEFADRFPDAVLAWREGRRLVLDLAEANRLQFLAAGVRADHIEVEGSCTLESENFFSHRGQPDGTRFAALVALR